MSRPSPSSWRRLERDGPTWQRCSGYNIQCFISRLPKLTDRVKDEEVRGGLETTGGGITESTDTAEIMTGDGDQSRSAVCSAAEIRCVG